VWLLTAPLVLSHFHIFSPIAIPLNVILTPLLLVALLSGLVVLLTGAWCWPVAWAAGWMCGLALTGIDQLVALARMLPGAYWWLPAPSNLWLLGFYLIPFGSWILVGFGAGVRRWMAPLLVGWLLVGVAPSIAGQAGWGLASRRLAAGHLQLTFIDVGHGLSVLIETPDRELWLYDAGQLGSSGRSFLPIAAVLWDRGASRLDGVLLSHADADHYNALPELYNRFPFPRLVTTEQVLASTGGDLERILHRLKAAGVELRSVTAGERGLPNIDRVGPYRREADSRWRVLHPPPAAADLGDNASSLCLLIEHFGRRILLTGDLEPPGTDMFLSQLDAPYKVDLLLAPHHGSLTHDPRTLLETTEPEHVVISGGRRSARPQVQTAFSDPHIQLWTTYLHGAIRVCVDNRGEIAVRHWQAGRWSISQGQVVPGSFPANQKKVELTRNQAASMSAEERLKQLELELPPAPKPVGLYKPMLTVDNLVYLSGHGPLKSDGSLIVGRVGADMDLAQGQAAARQTALAMLATLRAGLGSLDRVVRVVKLLGFVRCTAEFHQQPAVINGCSQIFADVFGSDAGIGTRSALGTHDLPSGIAVEVEGIFEIGN
jgi:competence protein ComEC